MLGEWDFSWWFLPSNGDFVKSQDSSDHHPQPYLSFCLSSHQSDGRGTRWGFSVKHWREGGFSWKVGKDDERWRVRSFFLICWWPDFCCNYSYCRVGMRMLKVVDISWNNILSWLMIVWLIFFLKTPRNLQVSEKGCRRVYNGRPWDAIPGFLTLELVGWRVDGIHKRRRGRGSISDIFLSVSI